MKSWIDGNGAVQESQVYSLVTGVYGAKDKNAECNCGGLMSSDLLKETPFSPMFGSGKMLRGALSREDALAVLASMLADLMR